MLVLIMIVLYIAVMSFCVYGIVGNVRENRAQKRRHLQWLAKKEEIASRLENKN